MTEHITISAETPWYDLFSRGSRDWLRHNQKVREAVKQNLPDLVAGPDVITGSQDRTVQVPVRLLEHARFRLADSSSQSYTSAGQGQGKPGDVLRQVQPDAGDETGEGGNNDGEVKLLLEFKVDDIIDWLWEELQLPDLQPKRNTSINDEEYVREGWDKHGASGWPIPRRKVIPAPDKARASRATCCARSSRMPAMKPAKAATTTAK
jgi:uncharacterized sporulation protein YeaH/YhbH (DUF444 family)